MAATVYFLAAYLVRSWGSIESFDWEFDAGWLALSGVVFLVYYFAQAGFWWLLLRGCGAPSPFWPAASVWGKSILARYVPGNVFMFVGRAWMSHSRGLSVERVSAAMVYEQALGVGGALLAVAVLFPFWEYRPGVTALSLVAIPVLIVLMHPRVFGPLAGWALRLLHRPPLEVTLGFGAVLGVLAPLHARLARGRRRRLDAGALHHRPRRGLAAAGDRRLRPGLRGRYGGVLHPQRHRRAGGGAHGLAVQGAARGRRPDVGAAAAALGDGDRARVRRPGRGRGAAGPAQR